MAVLKTKTNDDPVRAISIRQPYVEQILRGTKKIEYRTVRTSIRERVYLYASIKPAKNEDAWRDVRRKPGELPTGAILGTVEIVDCRLSRSGDEYHYVLARPKRLKTARRARNQPQPVFWRPHF